MLVQHRLALSFATAHVQEPLTWELTRRFQNVMFNVGAINVGVHEADMQLVLIGEPAEVKQAKEYLKEQGVTVRTLSSHKHRGKLPSAPKQPPKGRGGERIERKLWLTIIRGQRREPFLWTLGREFALGYKITHSVSGEHMAIISLVAWGEAEEVQRAVSYLRQKGVTVEYGEAGVSAPFMPLE